MGCARCQRGEGEGTREVVVEQAKGCSKTAEHNAQASGVAEAEARAETKAKAAIGIGNGRSREKGVRGSCADLKAWQREQPKKKPALQAA